ncbi:MAG: hypothetical protein K2X87_13565 [Gemmataceae bacterium]|nr:hypothetical protein [Gemmataceae bacterium]
MTPAAPEPVYRIVSGVHRGVAAREAGLTGILAEVMDDEGVVLRRELVPLSRLYSPKPGIDRWDRGRDFAVLVGLMGTVAGRAAVEAITVSPLAPRYLPYLTPLLDVVVTGYPEDPP